MSTQLVTLPIVAGGLGAGVDVTSLGSRKTMIVTVIRGRVRLEISNDAGATWCQIGKPFRKNFNLSDILLSLRKLQLKINRDVQTLDFVAGMMRVNATSGSAAEVQVLAERSISRTSEVPAPAAPFLGPGKSLDITAFGCETTVVVQDFNGFGFINIEISGDDLEWATAYTFTYFNQGCLTKTINAKFIRVFGVFATATVSIGSVDSPAIAGLPTTGVIFQPGDPAGSRENIYVTWLEVINALAGLQDPGPKYLLFSANFGDCRIPAGSYDMTDVVFSDVPSNLQSFGCIYFEDGCFLPNLRSIEFQWSFWKVVNESVSGPVIVLNKQFTYPTMMRGSGGICAMTQSDPANTPIYRIEAPTFFRFGGIGYWGPFNNQSGDAERNLAPLVEVAAGAACGCFFEGGGIARNTFTGSGIVFLSHLFSANSGSYGPEDQPSFTGTLILGNANNVRLDITPLSTGTIAPYWNQHVQCSTAGAPVIVNLPTARSRQGEQIEVKDTLRKAGIHNITVNAFSVSVGPTALVLVADDGSNTDGSGNSTISGFDALAAGIRPGDTITLAGTPKSDGSYTVASLTGTTGVVVKGLNGFVLKEEDAPVGTVDYQETIDGFSTAVINTAGGALRLRAVNLKFSPDPFAQRPPAWAWAIV